MPRAIAHVVVLGLLAALLFGCPAAADPWPAPGPVLYVEPVDAPVLDPFRAPASPFGTGNRGIEYGTDPGAHVEAAGPGVVTFAGLVAGAKHVTVRHPDGRLSTYSFLAEVDVRVGRRVDAGDVVGRAGGPVHVSVREDGAYIDPALLFGEEVTTVRLVPENPEGGELWEQTARELMALAMFTRFEGGGGWGLIGDLAGGVIDGAGALLDAVGASLPVLFEIALFLGPIVVGAVYGPVVAAIVFGIIVPVAIGREAPLLDILIELNPFTVGLRLGRRAREWWDHRSNCTPGDVEPPEPEERRVAVLVAGFGSRSDDASIGDVDVEALGYEAADVVGFSYAGGRTPDAFGAGADRVSDDLRGLPVADYDVDDSSQDLLERGGLLADLLAQVAADSPGTPIDLVAHSQGGIVARLALDDLRGRPGGPEALASLGLVATIGTPHQGADLATVAMLAAETGEGAFGLAVADRVLGVPVDPGEADNIPDLALRSNLLDGLDASGLPPGPTYLSLSARGDLVVLADRTRLAGGSNVVLPVDGLSAHGELPGHPATERELALALAGMPRTCESFGEFFVDTVASEVSHLGVVGFSGAAAEATMFSVVPDLFGDVLADFLVR